MQANLISKVNQPQAPDQAVDGWMRHGFSEQDRFASSQARLSAPLIPLSAIGDQPGSEASRREAVAQLELLL